MDAIVSSGTGESGTGVPPVDFNRHGQDAHATLDAHAAIAAAYGWPASLSDDEILEKLLELNLAASSV